MLTIDGQVDSLYAYISNSVAISDTRIETSVHGDVNYMLGLIPQVDDLNRAQVET